MSYIPPFTISAEAINMIAENSAQIERYAITASTNAGHSGSKEFGVKYGVKFGVNEKNVLLLLASNPSLSAEYIASQIGLSKRGVEKQLKKFRDLGIIVRKGSDKTGYWEICKRKR